MRQQTDLILPKNTVKGTLKVCSLMVLSLYCLNGERAQGDSTFFPEDTNFKESAPDAMTKESSAAIKEWAELSPPKKETAELIPAKIEGTKEINLAQPQETTPEKLEAQKQEPVSIVAITPDPKVSPSSEEQKPLDVVAITPDPKVSSSSEKQQPLQLTTVQPHPKALPVHEKAQAKEQNSSPKTVVSYAEAANDRAPLGVVEATQEVHNQKWYIYSSAIRGLKNTSDSVHIVSLVGTAPGRGEEVKNLLVEMGIEPEKVKLIHAKGEQSQAGTIYIFAGK